MKNGLPSHNEVEVVLDDEAVFIRRFHVMHVAAVRRIAIVSIQGS
jgi:hypothetical protein